MFTISVEDLDDDTKVLRLKGRFDAYTSLDLQQTVCCLLLEEGVINIIIDLEKIDFIDCVALGTTVGCLGRIYRGPGLGTLVCNNPQVVKVFDITGLSETFGLSGSQDEALAYLRRAIEIKRQVAPS